MEQKRRKIILAELQSIVKIKKYSSKINTRGMCINQSFIIAAAQLGQHLKE